MPILTLSETHEYALDGIPVLGVSEILSAAGLIDDSWRSEEALKRGSFVHEAIQFHVEGTLEESSVDPKVVGYLEAWKKFEREVGFKVHCVGGCWQSEIRRHHPFYGYAGTMDHLGEIQGRVTIVDVKSGAPKPADAWQLALYAMLFDAVTGMLRPDRVNVYVQPNGDYRMIHHKSRTDFEIAKAAITIAQARIDAGLVERKKKS